MAPVKIVWTRDGQAPARVQTFCFPASAARVTTADSAGAADTAGVLRGASPLSAGRRSPAER
jgi:hypothetical protein